MSFTYNSLGYNKSSTPKIPRSTQPKQPTNNTHGGVRMGQGSSRPVTHSPTTRSGLSNYFSF